MPWAEVLAEMEAWVEAAEGVVFQGGPVPAPFRLPPDLGPLPAHLVARARAVQAATDHVASLVRAAQSRVTDALCRPQERITPRPAYVDARA